MDAIYDFKSLARMANHSWMKGYAHKSKKVVKTKAYLVLLAATNSKIGHKIMYNYGDQAVLKDGDEFPWMRAITKYN